MCSCELPDVEIKLHHTSPSGRTVGHVDPCIAPLVQVLNYGGFQTIASCCGHNRIPGNVIFEDNTPGMRGLMIIRNDYEWDIVSKALCSVTRP